MAQAGRLVLADSCTLRRVVTESGLPLTGYDDQGTAEAFCRSCCEALAAGPGSGKVHGLHV